MRKPAALCLYVLALCLGTACAPGQTPASPPPGRTQAPVSSLLIREVRASSVTVEIQNAGGGLCVIAAYDQTGAIVTSAAHRVTKAWESACVRMELPPTPAIYTVRAVVLDGGLQPQCEALPVTAAMYSQTASDSRVTGIFIAPELASEATEAQWREALQNMRDIGVDTVIVQYAYQNDSRYGHQAYFPYADEDTVPDAAWHPLRRTQIGSILAASQALGLKVFLGLQVAEYEWFDRDMFRDSQWLEAQAGLSLRLADALWDAFGTQYRDVIAGWYLPLEFESGEEYYDYFDQLTQVYYAPLTAALKSGAHGSLPILISPLKYDGDDKAAWKRNLETVLAGAQIDVIAPQDGIGFGTQSHDTVSGWFRATREAVDAVNSRYARSISLWGNCENYARLRDPDEKDPIEKIKPMSIGKFISSLDVAAPYTDKLITFSIHRWDTVLWENSAVEVNRPYYEAYKRYSMTGLKPVSKAEGYYVRILPQAGGALRFHPDAGAGLCDGFAADPDDWHAYRGIHTDNGVPFTMEIRFDDPTAIRSVASHYYQDTSAAVALPQQVQYEYLVRTGDNDEIFTYTVFALDAPQDDGVTASTAALDAPVMADGVRITVTPGGEWTFLDDIRVT